MKFKSNKQNRYTIELVIHGLHAEYNKVPLWEYTAMLKAFGPDVHSKPYKVATAADLDTLLKDKGFNRASSLQVCYS